MRKLLLLLLCLHPMLGLAGDYPCVYLHVQIKNQTQSACHLVGFKLVSGFLPHFVDLPLVISEGQLSDELVVSEGVNDQADLILTYECGENKTVKFASQKGLCRRNAVVDGTLLYANHLDARFEASNGLYWGNKPGFITWTLTEIS